MGNTINGKHTLEAWLLVLILFYASFSSSLALRLSSMSAAVLYKTKNNNNNNNKKRPLSIEQRFLIQLNSSTTTTLGTGESGSRCKEVAVVERFKRESRGAIHSTKIPTGPTGKIGPPQ